jgi:Uma2 family endonuclease
MSIASPPPKLITIEEFLVLPEDGIDRDLINGQIREQPMTKRNRFHAETEATIARLIGNWVAEQPIKLGKVYSGEVGCSLRRNPDTNVGIDVAYFSAETVAQQTDTTTMMEGVPELAVEILSPSDTIEAISEKVELYLETGVKLVWIVDPRFKTVTVHRSDELPRLFNIQQQLSGDPFLKELMIKVQKIFGA